MNSRILSNTLFINLIAIIYVIQTGCKNIEQLMHIIFMPRISNIYQNIKC